MMGWVKHEFSSRGSVTPKISIRGGLQIGFNAAAVSDFKLDKVVYAELYFNPEIKAIGVKPVDKPSKGAKKINHGKGGTYIAAKKFIYDYELAKLEEKRLDCEWDKDLKMIVARIK
jgi:hypothetical protein